MRALLILVAAATLLGGCVDRTGRSRTYMLTDKVDSTWERTRDIEKDLGHERGRIDSIQDRAAQARKRLADSGATLETFLDELTSLRGEIATLQHTIEESGRFSEDLDLRLMSLEMQLAHMQQVLEVPPMPSTMGSPAPADPAADPAEDPSAEEPPPEDAPAEPVPAADAPADPTPGDTSIEPGEVADPIKAEFDAAVAMVQDRKWEEAGAKLQSFLRRNKKSEFALEAQYLIGQCLFELGRYKNAITEFQKVIETEDKARRRNDGPAYWAPKGMFMQGLAFEELGTKQDVEAAKLFFDELLKLYPDSAEAGRAKRRLDQLDAQ